MSMTERSFAYENTQSFELRKMRVLDGSAARARADAKRIDSVKLALGVIAVLVYLLSLTFVEAKISNTGAQINDLNAAIADTQNDSAIMDLNIGSLASLDRIETYATTYLGMTYPNADSVYFLDVESSLAIASGETDLALAESNNVESAEETKYPLWEIALDSISDFFRGTALAAE